MFMKDLAYDNIKNHKKQGLHPLTTKYIFACLEKPQGEGSGDGGEKCQIVSSSIWTVFSSCAKLLHIYVYIYIYYIYIYIYIYILKLHYKEIEKSILYKEKVYKNLKSPYISILTC